MRSPFPVVVKNLIPGAIQFRDGVTVLVGGISAVIVHRVFSVAGTLLAGIGAQAPPTATLHPALAFLIGSSWYALAIAVRKKKRSGDRKSSNEIPAEGSQALQKHGELLAAMNECL